MKFSSTHTFLVAFGYWATICLQHWMMIYICCDCSIHEDSVDGKLAGCCRKRRCCCCCLGAGLAVNSSHMTHITCKKVHFGVNTVRAICVRTSHTLLVFAVTGSFIYEKTGENIFSTDGPMIDYYYRKSVDYGNYSDDRLWKLIIDYNFFPSNHFIFVILY